MKFRLVTHWPSDDILPTLQDFDTALEALQRFSELKTYGMRAVSIFEMDGSTARRISRRRLENLVRCCAKPTGRKRRRARKAIASTLLGLIASALPNSFGDLGVFSVSSSFRVARTTRALDQHRSYR
jgi:hypothetical protein